MLLKGDGDGVLVEKALLLSHTSLAGGQCIVRLQAPNIAAHAKPGSYIHLSEQISTPRQALSIMRADAKQGWLELLYGSLADGAELLAESYVSQRVSIEGPLGTPFTMHQEKRRPLLIAAGVAMASMIFAAQTLRNNRHYSPFVILGSEVPFPFTAKPSQIMVPGMPAGVIAALPLLEDWGLASRLASAQGFAGCLDGRVDELAGYWLAALSEEQRAEVAIYCAGPQPVTQVVAELAQRYDLPCQFV